MSSSSNIAQKRMLMETEPFHHKSETPSLKPPKRPKPLKQKSSSPEPAMARLLQASRRAFLTHSSSSLKTLIAGFIQNPSSQVKNAIHFSLFQSRNYISEMRKSALEGNILRVLRTEMQYQSEYAPLQQPITQYESFIIEDQPGDQWIRLRRKFGDKEEIKIEATMFDGSVQQSEKDDDVKLHISLIVDVWKEGCGTFEFVCSAWPDSLEIQKVFMLKPGGLPKNAFLGPNFKELDDKLQHSLQEFLEERGVDDELAGFLHEYMNNKDKRELIRWMDTLKAYIEE